MSELYTLTLRQAIDGIKAKRFSSKDVWQSVSQRIAKVNPELNIYTSVADTPISPTTGPLAGLPLAVKDNILVQGLPTTASSNVLREYQPHYEATLWRQVAAAGGSVIGKTNLDAWAHGSSTETSDFGPTKNPLNPEYVPGGSSGGSAAAVAADACIAAIGTETAGSIRLPAAWCGIVGLKPTYGRVSRYGVIAMGSSLDSPGPMTKTVYDSALLLEHMAGQDRYDGTTSPEPVGKYVAALGGSVAGMKIGFVYLNDIEDPTIRAQYERVMQELRDLGADVEEAQAMNPEYAIGMYAVIQRGEVSSNLARFDGIRYGEGREAFGTEAKRRIMLGTYTLSKGYADKYYVHAQQVRTLYIQDFARLFGQYDLLVAPSAPGYALKLGESAKYPYFGELIDRFVEPCSMAGLPGISVPCHHDERTNLALGMNIIAPAWHEERMLTLASAYEASTPWNHWAQAEKELA